MKVTTILISILLLTILPSITAEDDPPEPPRQPPYINFLVNPNWTYIDGSLSFWCHYLDAENRTVDSANIFIDNVSYELWHNTTNSSMENPRSGKNFMYHADGPWERRTYEFYFQITNGTLVTNSSFGYFDIVNREPYLLAPPPVKMYVAEEFEWEGRAHDPDLDYLSWNWSSNITGSSEWEFQQNNTSMKLKIKCNSAFVGWINVSIQDNYTSDYMNWTLICYAPGEEKGEPSPPRSGVGKTPSHLTGISDDSILSDDPPRPLASHTDYYWFGHVNNNWDDKANWEPTSAGDYPKDADDRAFIDDEIRPDLTIQAGASSILTIGYLQINATYTGTMTSQVDLFLVSSGAHNGSIAADGGTWDINGKIVYVDGDFYIGSTTISNPARVIFQGGVTQNLQSGGEILYQITVDNIASTILYLKDSAQFFDLTILSAGTFEIDSVSEGASLTLSFTDSANCGFVSSSSGTLLAQGDVTNGVTITTADAAPPPTNYWLGFPSGTWGALAQLSYTTISYGQAMTLGYGSVQKCISCTIQNMAGTTALQIRSPQAGYEFTDISFSSISSTLRVLLLTAGMNNQLLTNIVITSSTATYEVSIDWRSATNPIEFVNSNFDTSKVYLAGSAHANAWISKTHNDVANAYKIGCQAGYSFLKSSITNDFGTGDNVELVSGKFVMDENGAAETVRIDSGTTFQIGADTPSASRTLTFDDTAGAGFHASSTGTLIGKGTATWEQYITSAATPPTNYWSGDMSTGDPTITMDYTTLSYGTLMNTGGTWDVDDSTFDNFKNTAYAVEIETGATITSFTDNTISNAGYGLDAQVAYTAFDNIVITTMSTTDIRANDVDIEFTNSNFDVTQVNLATTGNVFSDTHDDMTNAYKVICSNADKTGITNDFGSADRVEFVSNGCAFTIDEDADATDVWIQTNTVITHNSGTTWTISGNGNLTLNGSLVSSGIITYSGAQWFTFFINYNAYLYLNTSTVINADIVKSFNYTIGANNYGAVDELNITQPTGADNIINITQRDFSAKGSGTVLTFTSNNSAAVTTGYNVDNLTTGLAYEVVINGTTEYTITAAGSAISFSHASEGIRTILIRYTANITGNGSVTSKHLRVYISYASINYRTFDFNSNLVGTDPPYRFAWSFGDGYISTERNPDHQYDLGFALWMDYDIKLTAEDDKRRVMEDETSIRVYNWPVIFIVAFIIAICLVGLVIAIRSKE